MKVSLFTALTALAISAYAAPTPMLGAIASIVGHMSPADILRNDALGMLPPDMLPPNKGTSVSTQDINPEWRGPRTYAIGSQCCDLSM